MRVLPKTEPRDAWQYVPEQGAFEWPLWVLNSTSWGGENEDDLFLVRRSGKQLVKPGDWLIRDLDGDPERLTDAEMRKQYQQVAT